MFPVKVEIQDDALLLPFTSSWGWATWERAWRHFDAISAGYERLVKNHNLRQTFDLNGRYEYFKMLDSQMRGKTDSWAIRWYLTVFLMKGLALYPRKSLVENYGFDGSGVNCVASSIEVAKIDPYFRVDAMPQQVSVSEKCRDILEGLPRPKLNIRTMLSKVRHLVAGFCSERIS
jgi:hypothetical protein